MSPKFVFLLATLCLSCSMVASYEQTMTMYESVTENIGAHDFNGNVPDAGNYSLGRVQRICRYGFWVFYYATDYANYHETQSSPTGNCANLRFDFSDLSFRHVGASDTDVDALSLYRNTNWEGPEIYVEDSFHANISTPIGSLGYTGKTNWRVFKEPNFEGDSYCLGEPPADQQYVYIYDIGLNFGFSTIGSVVKGCDTKIENGRVV